MVDIDFLSQLIDSMGDAAHKLNIAVSKNKVEEANRLRTFVFDLHQQIEKAITNKNV